MFALILQVKHLTIYKSLAGVCVVTPLPFSPQTLLLRSFALDLQNDGCLFDLGDCYSSVLLLVASPWNEEKVRKALLLNCIFVHSFNVLLPSLLYQKVGFLYLHTLAFSSLIFLK